MNSQKERVSQNSFTGWRAAGLLAVGLALGGWLAGPAFAQQQTQQSQEQASATNTAKPVTTVKDATKSAAPATKTSGSSSSAANSSSVSAVSTVSTDASSSDASSSSDAAPTPNLLTIGNYAVSGSVNAGWRYSNITGSAANYDTFVNLQQGPRLLDVSLNLRSLNHNGALFDNLSLTGFGFGGDPVDVVRLNMSKDKWYNFSATYRRYKYFWGYNLLANPLNPANSNPNLAVTTAPHLMDLSHRMSDFNLTLLPQSNVRFRLGYAHSLEVGPSYTTTEATVGAEQESGVVSLLFQGYKTTNDLYHAGVDFSLLPRTTFSYDQYVNHYKQDTQWYDANLGYQLSNGQPVDLGLVFNTLGSTPCASPVSNSSTTPPTTNPACQGDLYYDRGGRPRGTTPTERFSFQSTYFRNLNMTGAISYSSGDEAVNDLYDTWAGLNTRTHAAGSDATAATKANRIIVNGNWDAVYQITSKFRAMDSFSYNSFRIPGLDNFGVVNFYAQAAPGGGYSMLLPPGQFNATDCPPPYTAATCPQHGSSSGPDLATGYNSRYLGQDFRSNTFMLAYDFTPKIGARLGYRYTKRKIYDFNALYYTAETFFPGGNTGTTAAPITGPATAARGDCALPKGGTFPADLPAGCTLQPDGSVVFTGLTGDSDTAHNLSADINGNSALMGLWVRPANNFRTSFNLELSSFDQSFARITPRLLRRYQINSVYTPVHWAEITGEVDIVDSSNSVTEVQNQNHNRSYAITTMFTPASEFSFDLSYNYSDIYTQALVCYAASGPAGTGAAPCPIPGSPVPYAAITTYSSKTNFASADMMVKPAKQVTFTLGYAGSFVKGTPSWFNPLSTYSLNFLDPLTPYGPLRFNYQTPYMKLNWIIYKGLSYDIGWNYYGYNTRGENNPVGLAPLGTQDFNGNNMTVAVKYSF